MAAPTFYNQGDQDIYNSGQHFVPQEKYRLGYTPPAAPEVISPVPGGITNTNAFNNSGSGFSVYNPDPNSIVNRNYDPYRYEEATDENFTRPEPTGANKFLGSLTNLIPGKGIGEFLTSYMPPNRRKILENELGVEGIMVNDIGQIVQGGGDYNTADNIMAGYNASKIDANTYQKRRDMINDTIKRKTKAAELKGEVYDSEYLDNRLDALDASEETVLDTATGRADEIVDFEEEEKEKKKNKTKSFLSNIFRRKKAPSDGGVAKEKQAVEIERAKRGQAPSDPDSRGRDDTPGFGKTTAGNYTNQFQGGDPGLMAKGGRAGYFFGGRVNYKAGGRTDAESQYGADSAGSYDSSQNQSGREQSYGGGNDNPSFYEPKPSFFNNPEILSKETIIGNVPMGIGFDNSYGRYKATMDLEESLKKKGLEGGIEYNNNIGNFDLAAKYNPQDGSSYGAGYTGNNFDVGVNNKTGASANYSKDIFDGRGKITAGGTYNPNGTYNAEGKIIFNYANGGLAGLL